MAGIIARITAHIMAHIMAHVIVIAAVLALLEALTAPDPPRTYAAPAPAQQAIGRPTMGTKVILGETSIDGPALWTNAGNAPLGAPRAVLAWTGTDPEHHLNYMTSVDGLHYGAKQILSETSPFRPSVTEIVNSDGSPQFIVLAWTGTDPSHTLNILYVDANTNQPFTKLTLTGETSFTAPAIAAHCCAGSGELRLAWAGTDPSQTLNVISISADRRVVAKTTLFGLTSIAAPYLNDASPQFDTWLLSWAGFNRRLNFAESVVGSSAWTVRTPLAEFSGAGPSMIELPAGNVPRFWVAWSGTFRDTAHHLNVQYTQSFPAWPTDNSKTVFADTCFGSPQMGSLGINGQTLVAWTGTDAAHSLNVAGLLVATTR
jgi:hypothetical protein